MTDKQELDTLIWDVTDMGVRVENIGVILNNMDEGTSKTNYLNQFHDLMEQYNQLTLYLKEELEDYIAYEKKNNLVIDFEYRKLMKALNEYEVM